MSTVAVNWTAQEVPIAGEIVCAFTDGMAHEIDALWTPGLAGQTDENWNLRPTLAGYTDPSRHLRVCVTVCGLPVGFLILTTTVQFRGRLLGTKAILVEFLAVAPWCRSRNVCQDDRHPSVPGVGPLLLGLAGRISLRLGHEGAFCFFSEVAADRWYQKSFARAGVVYERLPSESDGSDFYPYYEIPGVAGARLADQYGIPELPEL